MRRRALALLLALVVLFAGQGAALALAAPERMLDMPRQPTGNTYQSRGRWYARLRIGPTGNDRQSFQLPEHFGKVAAGERKELLADLAARLRAANVPRDITVGLLTRAAAREGQELAAVLEAAARVCRGEVALPAGAPETFEEVGRAWTSGDLARTYPDHVRVKDTAAQDKGALEQHVYPHVRTVRIAEFTLDHALNVMAALPPELAPTTRRNIWARMHRVLALAVFPLRLIEAHPLPKEASPKAGPEKIRQFLYPDEDARLLACAGVHLAYRIFYGFLAREGMRANEAARLHVGDVDLERGALVLLKNKTRRPRAWALTTGVLEALRAWIAWREKKAGKPLASGELLFAAPRGGRIHLAHLAEAFREHLRTAGVDRAVLYQRTPECRPIRIHDTRATFITVGLANGKTEAEISQKTGHRSSAEINGYRREAATLAELRLGDLQPLHEAIPELRAVAPDAGGKGGAKGGAPPPRSRNIANSKAESGEMSVVDAALRVSRHGSAPTHRCAAAAISMRPPIPRRESG